MIARATLTVAIVGGSLAGPARAERELANQQPAAVDIKEVAARLVAYRDDHGKLYVLPGFGEPARSKDLQGFVFYGDGKVLYQQRVVGTTNVTDQSDWSLWSPRVQGAPYARLRLHPDGCSLSCRRVDRQEQRRSLVRLSDDETRKLFAQATFLAPLWRREASFFARDPGGVYYYVDAVRPEHGGHGHRVFVGRQGAMKQLGLTNVVADSGGSRFATRTGELRIDADGKASWHRGAKRLELLVLDPAPNRYLIYRQLGIYGQLGTVCEDQ
ncbi:MAG: hypothetical protein M3680_04085 [Myxococcota bacterium]|nr:hypothetical protein [Myxococcota bacterium]